MAAGTNPLWINLFGATARHLRNVVRMRYDEFQSRTTGGHHMLWTLALVLFILWILGFGVFHVAGGLIHLLLVLAVVAIVWNLIAGRRTV
jgi:uncharacterized protein DUF5670